jgi:hypothetical protein
MHVVASQSTRESSQLRSHNERVLLCSRHRVHEQPVSSDVANGNGCELSFAVLAIYLGRFIPYVALHPKNQKLSADNGKVLFACDFSTPLSAASSCDKLTMVRGIVFQLAAVLSKCI